MWVHLITSVEPLLPLFFMCGISRHMLGGACVDLGLRHTPNYKLGDVGVAK